MVDNPNTPLLNAIAREYYEKQSINMEIKKGTYRELLSELIGLTDEQLDQPIMVELSYEELCLPGELRICGENNNYLPDNHPVIFVK